MLICPRCGVPRSEPTISMDSKQVKCARCTWSGTSEELLFIPDEKCNTEVFQGQLEKFYVAMATGISPLIGKLLLDCGLIERPKGMESPADKHRIEFIARTLQAATNGAVQAIIAAMVEEMNDGGWTEPVRQ